MRRSAPFLLFFALIVGFLSIEFFIAVNVGFATTCTFSGNTTYCSDPKTGKTTTYNQYGDNIYGSDGSSATIYHDPAYGSGSGMPSVSTAGVDMDSAEMKAAQAKYDQACVTPGPTCTQAVADWLQALSEAPRSNTSSGSDTEDDDYSDSRDEDLDEWTKKVLSDFGISNGSSQSEISCVPNSHVEGRECACDIGYFNNFKHSCVPLSDQNCIGVYGEGVVANTSINSCVCKTGYVAGNTFGSGCVASFNSSNESTTKPSFLDQSELRVGNAPTNFEVKSEDILPLNGTGNINGKAVLRQCPSTQCSKIGSYTKGTVVEILGEYKNDTWFKVNVINSKEGWMHQSLVDAVIKQSESQNDTSPMIQMTRAEYEAKYGAPVHTEVETGAEAENVGWWRKIFNWFGF